jgi:hypothetical protein
MVAGDDFVCSPYKIFEMSKASAGTKMKFYEDFFAITVVSYIYYEVEEKHKHRKSYLQGSALDSFDYDDGIDPNILDRDILINDPETR